MVEMERKELGSGMGISYTLIAKEKGGDEVGFSSSLEGAC